MALSGACAQAQVVEGAVRLLGADALALAHAPGAPPLLVRLYAVRAPHGAQTCRDADDEPVACGSEARRWLARRLGDAPVRCTAVRRAVRRHAIVPARLVDPAADAKAPPRRVPALDARCTSPSVGDLGAALLGAGYAHAATPGPYADLFYVHASRAAREAGRGLWRPGLRFEPFEDFRRRLLAPAALKRPSPPRRAAAAPPP